ncbi:MAG: tRNA-dihydrouridine synthase [Actinomycetia bacterium]|nr:tRNA-dihydrouridine synthase [Actinomycetes bacterium]
MTEHDHDQREASRQSGEMTDPRNAWPHSQRLVLAPMAGINDPLWRRICWEQGADLCYSEMISAAGLAYRNPHSRALLCRAADEPPWVVQLFGHDPDLLVQAAVQLMEEQGNSLAGVDLNMGCATPKIAGRGDGAALMLQPALASEILTRLVRAVPVPITVKIRRGYHSGQENAPELARRAEASGVQAIAVHGRWAEQLFRGRADRGVIARVQAAVSIPVIASGDVYTVADIQDYLQVQGADAVMIARGALGNPWLFRAAQAALCSEAIQPALPVSLTERVAVARAHCRGLAELCPERLVGLRKHLAWYFRGLPGATAIRQAVNYCKTLTDYLSLLERVETGEL